MKKNIFKQVLSAMVLTMSLAGGAAFVSANSVQYSENGDYQAAVNLSVPAVTKTADFGGYSENRDYRAAINTNVPASVKNDNVRGYSENRDFVAASAFDNH
ncbi:MAG: hypothetical protein ACLVCZ_11650 [Megasphaera sp.]